MLRIFGHYVSKVLILVLLGDLAVLIAATGFAHAVAVEVGENPFWPRLLIPGLALIPLLYLADLYNFQVRRRSSELVTRILLTSLCASIAILVASYTMTWFSVHRMELFSTISFFTLGLIGLRTATDHLGANKRLQKRVLVLGTGLAAPIISYEGSHTGMPFKIIGFLDDAPEACDQLPGGYDLLGKVKDLPSIVERFRPDMLLVALTNMRGSFPVDDILECRFNGIRIEEWPTFYEKLTGKIFVNNLRPSWLIFAHGSVTTRLTETIKRFLDITFSAVGLILSAPLMIMTAICIKIDSSGPVLFRQERVGKHGKVYTLYKFRSMRVDAERATGPVWASEKDPRVTRVGKIIRKIRLDETPQMFNVLVGNMSFIGPRPERPIFVNQLKEQIPFYGLRFSVKPGITGWAQVQYQYGSSVEDAMEKLQYDLYYVKNFSVFLDVLILLNTIRVVLFNKGAR
jgi:sugar transferase (PEP-CTERM system associated)